MSVTGSPSPNLVLQSGNPTRGVLEACLASLDGAKHALCFSSGLGTTTAITHILKAGDHIVSMDDVYGGTNRYFRKCASRMGIETSFVDATNPENVAAAIRPNTRMVWVETPTNPTLKVVDIRAVADITQKHKDIFLVVDSTFLSSYFQRPLELGADIVMHSLTKYMNGHTDVIMGAACTNSEELHEKLRFLQNAIGPVPSPFDCFLVNRSVRGGGGGPVVMMCCQISQDSEGPNGGAPEERFDRGQVAGAASLH